MPALNVTRKLLLCLMPLAFAACSGQPYDPNRTAAALMVLGGGLQNYGAARATYQPMYQSTFCYPVGRGVQCQ